MNLTNSCHRIEHLLPQREARRNGIRCYRQGRRRSGESRALSLQKTLIVKLSPNVTDITEIARAAENGGADSVSLINTLLGMAIDAERRRPILSTVTGGMSGAAVKPIALRMVWQVAKAVKSPS